MEVTSVTYSSWCVVFLVLAAQLIAEQCITPNKEKAQCVSLYTCPVLLLALATGKNSVKEFVFKSNCGGSASNPLVCCGSSSDFLPQDVIEHTTKPPDLLPSREICGFQHSDDYFRPTNATSINEFPWLVRIHSRQTSESTPYRCNGALINRRYVLTSTRCLRAYSGLLIESVRLGEYHSKNDTDCVDEGQFDTECSGPPQDIDIEEITTHPNFSSITLANDIALIRLAKKVSYNDYVRPICLPRPGEKLAKPGDTLLSSGWGETYREEDDVEELVKKKVYAALLPHEECVNELFRIRFLNRPFNVSERQFCTRVFANNTDLECSEDNGGPVMIAHRYQWHQIGIISFGPHVCSDPRYPQVHTKVESYMGWIRENLKP